MNMKMVYNKRTEAIPKTKVKIKIKIKNKMDLISKINKRLAKTKTKLTNKIKSVNKAMSKLQDDSWLRLVELNKIDATLDEAINVVRYEIYGKKRKSPKMINIDKHKDIDGYVSKLTDVINNKIKLLNRMGDSIDHIISDIKNETNMIDEKIYKVSEMDNDTLHLINNKLKEIMIKLKQNLKKILV